MAITPELPGSPSAPNSKTAKSVVDPSIPTSKTAESAASPAIPNSKTAESLASPATPNSLTSESAASPAIPNSKTAESVASPATPVSKTAESIASPAIPNAKTAVTGAAIPRALIPLVDMHFDSQQFTQRGNPVEFADLFTYARSSSASFINRRIVNNKAEYFLDNDFVGTVTNLLTFSEQFNNSDWVKTRASILPNIEQAPDGTMTGDNLIETNESSTHYAQQQATFTASTDVTISFYAKPQGRTQLLINNSTLGVTALFDISTGAVLSATSTAIASISDASDGWKLCAMTFPSGAGGLQTLSARLAKGGTASYDGDGISGMSIWGAQATESPKRLPYVKTTTVSASDTFTESLRIEYNPATGENLGALIEGASVNRALRSEEFNLSWATTSVNIIENDTAAPDGTTSADKIEASSTASLQPFVNQTITVTATSNTFSVYAKASEVKFIQLIFGAGEVANDPRANFDIIGGVLGTIDPDLTASISSIVDGWFKLSITGLSIGTTMRPRIILIQSATDTRAQSNSWTSGDGAFIWGAQMEQLPFATSYIRTEGSTVTRAADDLSIPTAGNEAAEGSEATYFAEIRDTPVVDGGSGDSRYIFNSGDLLGNSSLRVRNSGPAENIHGSNTPDLKSNPVDPSFDLAAVYTPSNNLITGYYNGVQTVLADAGTAFIPDPNEPMGIGASNEGTFQLFGHIKKLSVYEEALTAQEVSLL